MTTSDWKETLRAIKITEPTPGKQSRDEFLAPDEIVSIKENSLRRELHRVMSEIEELARENRWDDIVSVAYPVDERFPELVEHGLDLDVRARVAFALGQVSRFDDAISELRVCVERDPSNFHYHSSLGYTAYNSLYAAMNKEILLRGKPRAERIDLAHKHLHRAQELRPDGVTNFYRQAMLYKKIEGKTEKSIPLFQRAVDNWEDLEAEEKKVRHQEHKNYVKALYQLASALLETGQARRALECIHKCINEDKDSNHLSLVYKYFALGKVCFELNDFDKAKDALVFALECCEGRAPDFVCELLARVWLAMEKADKALETISMVPESKRRPYYRWTEADVYCALGDFAKARAVLRAALERDKRSGHKALIRLTRIEYVHGNFKKGKEYATRAGEFFHERWGGILNEGLFWRALCAYRLGEYDEAHNLALELESINPRYPKLALLLERIRAARS